MGSARRVPRSGTNKDDGPPLTSDVGVIPRVEGLRRDFGRFRRTHPLRTRIPDALRQAALAALASGTTESDVRRACGVTSEQLARWRRQPRACEPRRSLQRAEPRVFPVVDGSADLLHCREPEEQEQELELRIGGWAICVRQLQR